MQECFIINKFLDDLNSRYRTDDCDNLLELEPVTQVLENSKRQQSISSESLTLESYLKEWKKLRNSQRPYKTPQEVESIF